VVAHGPGLPRHALCLGAFAHRPRVAGFVDGDGVRRQAVEVRESAGVGVGGQGFREVPGRLESGGGGRDNKGNRDRLLLLLSSDGNTGGEEFIVEIH
jgi:hypothetical protein